MNLPPHPFFIALQFLTILPVRLQNLPDGKNMGRSVLYYPLVGALIGILLASGIAVITDEFALRHAPLLASLLLAAWVMLTGGLHLDGLADSADALMGGFGDRQKTLDIMKDPTSGPMGVLALFLVLLIKFTALWQLAALHNWQAVTLAPVIGRTILIALFLTTPYVRQEGLGAVISKHLPKYVGIILLVVFAGITCSLTALNSSWLLTGVLLLVVTLVFFCLRSLMMQRLGGTTGDTAGALVELTEMSVLVTMAFAAG